MLTGKCLCEAIAYEVTGALGPVYNCHCSKCRRWHGAAFRTRASIRREHFRWVRGEEQLSFYNSAPNVTRSFCSICGSNLINTYADLPDIIGLPLGGLEQHPGRVPEAHIFVGSKSPWYEISDGLPEFESWPGDEAAVRSTQ
ncbi:MAG: GFA family protein [Myxococcales bacterium]|nr:GFA family protein [Myxococcales bacterium]